MEIRRLHANLNDFNDGVFEISGDEFNYAVKVLRQKQGFSVIVNVGDGYDYIGVITEIKKDRLFVKVSEKVENPATPKNKITLYQGSCKLGKNDFIVQKAVELGVSRVVFFTSDFVIEKDVNLERLNKIAKEALKQCDRADEVTVEFTTFENAVNVAENGIIFFEGDCDLSVNDIPSDVKSYFVGSEGGFSEKEIALAKENGIKTVSLGKRILRAETASVVATTLVQLKTGGLL